MSAQILSQHAIRQIDIIKVQNGNNHLVTDDVAVEEPLEIQLVFHDGTSKQRKSISVTMRTPGNDLELAAGFLFTEGIIANSESLSTGHGEHNSNLSNIVTIELAKGITPKLMNSERNFYTTSSCGVCGKSSIDSIKTASPFNDIMREMIHVQRELICSLPAVLRAHQHHFSSTGGIHASGLFNSKGRFIALREDVGRHNALDKLIGLALFKNWLPLNDHILLLSGRASFELVQKASMAGIRIIAAIGAPSSLAVDMAKDADITLLGFLRDDRFNIYHLGAQTIIE
ncbi:sulfurtransferase FdhD [Chitinophaga caeni]|uniref:Sulfur carrier protein FdhD n=1 Tax=Chitinophaga caeni TaxID=2029983 RepID=A0A291QY98_9BACT|nr:formate dehydrogenase accessory sulfurtransferase FdhD [Chitinophaga caeni]ATL48918.1 sulfurtransferase FdhD [Chitinophaga caeni]